MRDCRTKKEKRKGIKRMINNPEIVNKTKVLMFDTKYHGIYIQYDMLNKVFYLVSDNGGERPLNHFPYDIDIENFLKGIL